MAVVGCNKPGLLTSVRVDEKELLTNAGRGLVLWREGEQSAKGDTELEVVAEAPEELVVEESGPLRAVVRARGKFPGLHNGLLRYTVRITAFAGKKISGWMSGWKITVGWGFNLLQPTTQKNLP